MRGAGDVGRLLTTILSYGAGPLYNREPMDSRVSTYSPPRQKRSRESFDRYLDAAETLIREQGFEDLSVADVARLAGFSVGGLYSRFPNKRALLGAVRERFLNRMEDSIRAESEVGRDSDSCLGDAIRRMVGLFLRHFLSETAMFRAFILECADSAEFSGRCEKGDERRRQLFREALLAHADQVRHPNPVAAVDWAFNVVNLLIRERLIFGEAAQLAGGYSDQELEENLVQLTSVYLQGCDGVSL